MILRTCARCSEPSSEFAPNGKWLDRMQGPESPHPEAFDPDNRDRRSGKPTLLPSLAIREPASPASPGLTASLTLRCEGESPSLEGSHLGMRIAGQAYQPVAGPGTGRRREIR